MEQRLNPSNQPSEEELLQVGVPNAPFNSIASSVLTTPGANRSGVRVGNG